MRRAIAPLLSALAVLALAAGPAVDAAAAKEPLSVEMDQARVVELDKAASTVIVGNPAIVDVQVLSPKRLVLTGKSNGITNMVILDENGQPFIDEQVSVQTFEANTVRVYRQASRATYACTPKCVPTVTVGDDMSQFSQVVQQQSQRQSIVEDAAKNH
ncbi:pilus assembly protein N-terminal domain-containing protein [Jiella sonneratiae]|uniref:Pilus assembly protein N-terminal domain-containing protein n=1 Tax=Jiella sonneratiae TaxID=2816856 RepID=A0ABS3J8F7_9HYPH|nr:pilus assembly protein N-terminal domain-containing protein [Jiella sonneratiae]MBO0905952.1 pilus assembly protein N-terminal domain-containing protein [Jiella sonneratiae]